MMLNACLFTYAIFGLLGNIRVEFISQVGKNIVTLRLKTNLN